jgi:prepilin-type processing-associated H-X9-DG protein
VDPLSEDTVFGSGSVLYCSPCAHVLAAQQQSPDIAKAVLYGIFMSVAALGVWVLSSYLLAYWFGGLLHFLMLFSTPFIGLIIVLAVYRGAGRFRGRRLVWISCTLATITVIVYQSFLIRFLSASAYAHGSKSITPPNLFAIALPPISDTIGKFQSNPGGVVFLLILVILPAVLAFYAAGKLLSPVRLMVLSKGEQTLQPFQPSEAPPPVEPESEKPLPSPVGGISSWGVFWNLLLISFIAMILASILYPVFAKAREKARGTQCTSNVKQIALAIQMYSQDNGGQYPGIDGSSWVSKTAPYLGNSTEMYQCYSDHTMDKDGVSYAMSGLLIDADGKGIKISRVISPSEVGCLVDATPTDTYPNGRLIGGAAFHDPATYQAEISLRHSRGTMVGFCDGHAKYFQGIIDPQNTGSGPLRALYQVSPLGLIDNPIACVPDFTLRRTAADPVAVGGEYCTRALLLAASEAWKVKAKAPVKVLGFDGQFAAAARPANYLWGTGDGKESAWNVIPIARDAVVAIVAKGSKIAALPEMRNSSYEVDYPTLRRLFTTESARSSVHVYTMGVDSGTRRFFADRLGERGSSLRIDKKAIVVADDHAMIEKVTNDPYGIGYCSSAFADPDRVVVLALKTPGGRVHYYPQQSERRRWVVPDEPDWPWTRTLYAEYGGAAWQADGSGIANVMLAPGGAGTRALQAGPLFGTGLWGPK